VTAITRTPGVCSGCGGPTTPPKRVGLSPAKRCARCVRSQARLPADVLEELAIYRARRRARERGARVEMVRRADVWQRDEGVCGICSKPAERADWHLDHVVPLSKGGDHSMANVQVSHPSCNRRKAASLPSDNSAIVSA
jgi:5-methylcytosine-specific restriction endonuclease McrA